ncbi:MAG: EamA family transporter [Alphaproteobacteria bacterium]|jgi:drug/metabolite transporter (DMT)-like permease
MLNTWYVLAMISGAGLATRNLLFKGVSTKLDAALAALILAGAMTLVSLIYYVYKRLSTGEAWVAADTDMNAVSMAAIAGIGVAVANITLAFAYKAGGFASLTALLQNGFSITVTLILGALFLGEIIKPIQLLGILVVFLGVFMVTKG